MSAAQHTMTFVRFGDRALPTLIHVNVGLSDLPSPVLQPKPSRNPQMTPAASSTAQPDCATCNVRTSNDWNGHSSLESARLNEIKYHRPVKSSGTLFHQGDENAAVYTVSRGLFALRVVHPNGVAAIVGLGRPGQILGARSFLSNQAHRTTATALVDSSVCLMRRADAIRLTRQEPLAYAALVSCCLRSLDAAQNSLLLLSSLNARDRLTCLLLDLCAAEAGPPHPGPVTLSIPLSRPDMANMIGIQPESLSRLLSQLRAENLVTTAGRSIVVCDHARLAKLAEELVA